MRIVLPSVGALALEIPLKRLVRWLRPAAGDAVDWRARALEAELALLIERSRARLAEQHVASRLAELTVTLGWLQTVLQAPPANDDRYDADEP